MIIQTPLPFIITPGTLMDATEVQANFDYIVANVNAFAQPSGGSVTADIEWTLLDDVGTYLSATTFEMPGDQTAAFPVGRRVRSVNTGGTVYSVVVDSAVVLNTTVTVVNTSGTLDAGLAEVSIGTLSSINPSLPAFTHLLTNCTRSNSVTAATSATAVIASGGNTAGDVLSEWNSSTGRFTPKADGTYQIRSIGTVLAGTADVTLASTMSLFLYKNGIINAALGAVNWPFASGVQDNSVGMAGETAIALVVGDYIDVRLVFPAFSSGTVFATFTNAISRVVYP